MNQIFKKSSKKASLLFSYAIISILFIGAGASFAIGYRYVYAQVAGYPVGELYGTQDNFSCDTSSGYNYTFFRYNEGSSNDANWWDCQ
jgi:hypothetical protein